MFDILYPSDLTLHLTCPAFYDPRVIEGIIQPNLILINIQSSIDADFV